MSDLSAAVDSQDLSAAVQEAEDAIARITTSLDISQDCSFCLLVAYHWDEQKNHQLLEFFLSRHRNFSWSHPYFWPSCIKTVRQAPCGMCNEDKQCQLLGCLHSICPNCIKGHSESRVMNGELNLRCPIPSCGKMAASSIFLHYLSREANVMFKQTMANDFLATKAQEKRLMSHVAESFLAKGCVLVQMFKGLALKLWRDKKNLIASFLLVLFFCNLFCLGNTLTCALELGLVNLFAVVFDHQGYAALFVLQGFSVRIILSVDCTSSIHRLLFICHVEGLGSISLVFSEECYFGIAEVIRVSLSHIDIDI